MAEILIYDFIGADFFGEGVTAKSVKKQLDDIQPGEEITVRVNSPGGDVFDGFAIYNLLKMADNTIHVVVDGLAASAASIIAISGDTVSMAGNALMMIHNPWTFAIGDSSDMLKTAETLEKIKGSILNNYVAKSGMDRDELSAAMDAETWYSAAEAVAAGLADEEIDEDAVIENIAAPWIRNAPQREMAPARQDPAFRIAARARIKDYSA